MVGSDERAGIEARLRDFKMLGIAHQMEDYRCDHEAHVFRCHILRPVLLFRIADKFLDGCDHAQAHSHRDGARSLDGCAPGHRRLKAGRGTECGP
jgi:hypothetical protein